MSTGRARHPRSRVERALLNELQTRVENSLALASSSTGADLLAAAETPRPAPESATITINVAPRLSSNGGPQPSLFYRPDPNPGMGLRNPEPYSVRGLLPTEEYALRNYGVQHLTDYARSSALGKLSDYLPSHANARERFDALLTRIQQEQVRLTIQNELAASQAYGEWNRAEHRFHLAPMSARKQPIDIHAWAEFIRFGGDPAKEGIGIGIVPSIRAELHTPA